MTSKIILCQNVWSLFYIPPYWTPWIKNENPDIVCCQILHSSLSQLLFKVWLTIKCSSDKDKFCVPTFLAGNTKSFVKIDLFCPVAEAWWRACPSFQPSSCIKKGTWYQQASWGLPLQNWDCFVLHSDLDLFILPRKKLLLHFLLFTHIWHILEFGIERKVVTPNIVIFLLQ